MTSASAFGAQLPVTVMTLSVQFLRTSQEGTTFLHSSCTLGTLKEHSSVVRSRILSQCSMGQQFVVG